MYLATAWVVSVMLPPMAIFFPLFTLLEDFGYLPRVAFNLDRTFRRAGAHGKQALTMAMGWGCNAAGVVATRIIDSPRERLIAIITNNFALCNGRWPTQILVATIFVGGAVPAHWAGLISALAVVGVAVFGVVLTFATSWLLSRTLLRGEVSAFSLELPPYRPPRVLATLYTSLIDRTLYVLWRAVVFALPAGAVIWLVSNIPFGDASLAAAIVQWLRAVRRRARPVGRDPAGLHRGHSRQRDRGADDPDAHRARHRRARRGRGRGRDVRARLHDRHRGRAAGRRLDAAHGRVPDALQPGAQPVLHDHLHHLERDAEREVDHRVGAAAARRWASCCASSWRRPGGSCWVGAGCTPAVARSCRRLRARPRPNAATCGALFATIADRYDLITRVLSYGMDGRWKRRLIARAAVQPGERALDLATGTGDVAFALAARGCRGGRPRRDAPHAATGPRQAGAAPARRASPGPPAT